MRLFSTALGLIAITTAAGVVAAANPRVQAPYRPLPRSHGTLNPKHDPLNEHGTVIPIPTHWTGPAVHLIPTKWRSHDILVHSGHQTRHLAAVRAKTPIPNSAAHPMVIGKAQDHHTVTLRPGEYVEMQLQPELTWKFESADPKILKTVKPTDGQTEYQALAPGTATVKAYGRMKPKPGQMTAMFVILYQVTIQVRK